MAWTDTHKVIDARRIVSNLFTYFQTNQTDALLWAHGSALKDFQQFSDSVANRAFPVFPSIAFKRDSMTTGGKGEVLETEYSLVFEVVIENQGANTVVAQARSYAKAIASMMVNCPDSTLLANTGAVKGVITELADNFSEVKTNDMQNDFFQEFEVGATFSLVRGIYT
jgi:hypothetical protein